MDNKVLASVNIIVVFCLSFDIFYVFYDISYFYHLILFLSGDIEINPGPRSIRHRQCRLMYANIRGLQANLNDLSVASKQFDILLCSETLVSDMSHISEILVPGF